MFQENRFNPDGLILSERFGDTMENVVQPYLKDRGEEMTVQGE